jgi:hypothetical protein
MPTPDFFKVVTYRHDYHDDHSRVYLLAVKGHEGRPVWSASGAAALRFPTWRKAYNAAVKVGGLTYPVFL